jgi:hypothetical protein
LRHPWKAVRNQRIKQRGQIRWWSATWRGSGLGIADAIDAMFH